MSKKFATVLGTSLVFTMLLSLFGMQANSTYAQAATTATVAPTATGDTFDVLIEVSGIVKSITVQSPSVSIVTLDDGTTILVNSATTVGTPIVVGQAITVAAAPTDNNDGGPSFVARNVTISTPTPVVTMAATLSATAIATSVATAVPTLDATDAATLPATCDSGNTQPVAERLATAFGVSYAEIMGWHCEGFGFGEIARAYLLAQKGNKLTVTQIFALRSGGEGWGNIIKGSGISPSELAPGQVIRGKGKGKGNDNNENDNNGDGKGNGKGNGKK